jgi:methionyl-tRNA synthetase
VAEPSRFYITTPIYYVNDVPHLGHAYTTVAADAMARYHRARGRQVHYLTGTDEHGEKIEKAATARGLTPQAFTDSIVPSWKDCWKKLDVAYDDFIRTSEPRHEEFVKELWKRMAAAGDIYQGDYEGWYCVSDEAYFLDKELCLPGTGAAAGKPAPTSGAPGYCPTCGRDVEKRREASYFFKLSKYEQPLLEHYEKNPGFVQPAIRLNEVASFVRQGLRDLSVSRKRLRWGIPVPGDDSHVIYVWIDALTNYMSALGGPGKPLYETFWPCDVHLMGKEITRFHAIYWPAMLMSAGLPLPRRIVAHGWWTVNGAKMSKTDGNVVDPIELAEDLGPDAFRYFVLREVPLGADGDFSHKALVGRTNAELANDLGNLLHRAVAMTQKYVAGKIPELPPAGPARDAGTLPPDLALQEAARKAAAETAAQYEAVAPGRALEATWELVRAANHYIDVSAPWAVAKQQDAAQRLAMIVYHFLEALRWIGPLVAPVMPRAAAEIARRLGVPASEAARWPEAWYGLVAGAEVQAGPPLFPRIDADREAELLARWTRKVVKRYAAAAPPAPVPTATNAASPAALKAAAAAATAAAASAAPSTSNGTVSYDDFKRLDLRIARIAAAERIPKADRLLKLKIDLGGDERQVVAGIASKYAPEALVGKKVVFLANLQPAKIRGVESQGMVLAAGDPDVLALCAPDEDVPPGTRVK